MECKLRLSVTAARALAGLGLAVFCASASALPQNFTVEGRLYDGGGAPLATNDANIKFEILAESDATCSLYAETHANVDVNASDSSSVGVFALRLGTGTSVYQGTGTTLTTLFAPGTLSGVHSDGSACSVTVDASVGRLVRISVLYGSTYEALSPDTRVSPVPQALIADNAHTIEGYGTADLLLADATSASSLNQTNLLNVFSTTNYASLLQLLAGGTSSFGGRVVSSIGTPVTSDDAVNKGYADTTVAGQAVDLTAIGTTSGNGDVLIWSTAQDKWVAGALALSGTAGGDLTGNYPSPAIATGAVSTAKLADASVTTTKLLDDSVASSKLSSTGIAVNRLLITDNVSGTTVTYATCTLNQVMSWTATGWQCTDVSALSPVTSVAGKTGAVTLNAADISGLGSAAVLDAGTAGGDVVVLDASARLPAVDGSQLLDVNANAISLEGVAVSGTAPASHQVLSYNATTTRWEPTSLATAITSLAVSTGLLPAGGTITASGTISVNVGTSAQQIVQENSAGQIAQGPGLVGAPAYSFGGASQSGLYSPAKNILSLSTNATDRLVIDGAGNVGIGSSAPEVILSILGTGAQSAILLPRDTTANRPSGENGMLRYAIDTGALEAFVSGTWATLASGPGVGSVKSVVAGTGLIPGTITSTGTLNVNVGDGAGQIVQENGSGQIAQNSGGSGTPSYSFASDTTTGIFMNGAGNLNLTTAGTTALSVSNVQFVGIGTGAPISALHVVDNGSGTRGLTVDSYSLANQPASLLFRRAEINGGALTAVGSGDALGGLLATGYNGSSFPGGSAAGMLVWATESWSSSANGSALAFVTVGNGSATQTERFRVDQNGFVGIGTTVPAVALEIASTGSGSALLVPRDQQANRPAGANGMLRFNTSTSAFEFFQNNSWVSYNTGSAQGTLTSLTAGTGLVGGTITSSGTINVNVGSAATQLPQLNANAQLALAYGSAGAPTYSFGLNSTTGIYSPGTNALALATSGTSRLYVSGAGLVGLNTTTPGALLDVNGTGAQSAVIVPRDTTANRPSGVNGMLRYNQSSGAFEFFQNNGWVNYNTGSGQGTVTSVVAGTGFVGGTITSSGTLNVNVGTGSSQIPQLNSSAQELLANGSFAAPNYSFYNSPSTGMLSPTTNYLALVTGGTSRFVITSLGTVGINTTAPAALLDVYGSGSQSAMLVPRDSTANRPTGVNGMLRFSTTLNALETYASGSWQTIAAGTSVGTVQSIATGTGLVGGTITAQGTLSVNVGTAAYQIPQLDTSGTLKLMNGSAASPSFGFAASAMTTTGIYASQSSGGPQLMFAANGTTSVAITASQVGILTNAPNYNLDVYGSAHIGLGTGIGALIGAGTSASAPTYAFANAPNTGIYPPAVGQLAVAANGTTALTVGTDASVTIPVLAAGTSTLAISGTSPCTTTVVCGDPNGSGYAAYTFVNGGTSTTASKITCLTAKKPGQILYLSLSTPSGTTYNSVMFTYAYGSCPTNYYPVAAPTNSLTALNTSTTEKVNFTLVFDGANWNIFGVQ